MTIILTHRGLEPSKKEFYPESSYQSFKNQLERGFGIEFDANFVKDGIVVFHDANLDRITNGKYKNSMEEFSVSELKKIYKDEKDADLSELQEIIDLIKKSRSEINALHLKGKYQTINNLNKLIGVLNKNPDVLDKIIIFDVKPEAAEYLKSAILNINLAPSVAHEFDINRYNKVVNETLISIKDAIEYREFYNWVWLDEWDLIDENGEKKFYTQENFEILKKNGYKIALVTPELHATSPGLYGGESHKDAENKDKLFRRIREIIKLNPDAICTDYPEESMKIINGAI